jgi:hypothetical protein
VGNNDMMIGAKRIAAALKGPVGQIKLARVVSQHIVWFEDARSQGMTWDQIVAALTAVGATRADGTPFTRGPVSSAVWRAEKAISRPKSRRPAGGTTSAPAKQRVRRQESGASSGSKISDRERGQNEVSTKEQRAITAGVQTNSDRGALLRLMKRAGKQRTSADDDKE